MSLINRVFIASGIFLKLPLAIKARKITTFTLLKCLLLLQLNTLSSDCFLSHRVNR